jgi:hypothetical protein
MKNVILLLVLVVASSTVAQENPFEQAVGGLVGWHALYVAYKDVPDQMPEGADLADFINAAAECFDWVWICANETSCDEPDWDFQQAWMDGIGFFDAGSPLWPDDADFTISALGDGDDVTCVEVMWSEGASLFDVALVGDTYLVRGVQYGL